MAPFARAIFSTLLVPAQPTVLSWRRSSKFNEAFLSIILVGKTGTGKSTTANTILGEEKFQVSPALESMTKTVQYEDVEYVSTTYRIFDTPGYLDVDVTSMDVTDEIAHWIRSSTHGLDAFVLLLPYVRLGKEHWESYQTFKNSFGLAAINRTIIAMTQLKPASLSSEDAARHMTECCKPGGELRQVCCEVLELRNQGNPVIGIGDPSDPERRARDRVEIFKAVQTVVSQYPMPYSNLVFDKIHAGRNKLLHEINLLKFNHHRSAMRALYEEYYAPEVVARTINADISTGALWKALHKFQLDEQKAKEDLASKWGYRFIASIIVSLILEALVSLSEPLVWIERSYRTMLFFALYCALCITDLGAVGLQSLLKMIPPLWIFDVTSLMDLYFKLDDIVPLFVAATVHLLYITTHSALRYVCHFFEAIYLTAILGTLVHEILVRGLFPPQGNVPIERWCFIVMMISMLGFLCQFDDDHVLNSDRIPKPIWRYRMAWRRPIKTAFEAVETDTRLHDETPENEYPMRWKRLDTPWSLDSFRNERLERVSELHRTIHLFHKDRGDLYTIRALEDLPPVTISLPPPNTGADVNRRILNTVLAIANAFGAMVIFLGHPVGSVVAAIDVLYLIQRLCNFAWYAFISTDPELECATYSSEWVVKHLELKE